MDNQTGPDIEPTMEEEKAVRETPREETFMQISR